MTWGELSEEGYGISTQETRIIWGNWQLKNAAKTFDRLLEPDFSTVWLKHNTLF